MTRWLTAPRRWLAEQVFRRRMKRAVRSFNTMVPQQRLLVFISLLRDNPEIALAFRRALKMQDPPKTPTTPERRIVLPSDVASRRELYRQRG